MFCIIQYIIEVCGSIFFPERFYTDYQVKTLVSVSLLPLYCMSYITFISLLIDSLILNLRHLILTTFYTLSGVFVPLTFTSFSLVFATFPQLTFLLLCHFVPIPSKIIYNSRNKPYKGMQSYEKFDLASPSIDHSIKFSDSL